jgi:hypothetical protein
VRLRGPRHAEADRQPLGGAQARPAQPHAGRQVGALLERLRHQREAEAEPQGGAQAQAGPRHVPRDVDAAHGQRARQPEAHASRQEAGRLTGGRARWVVIAAWVVVAAALAPLQPKLQDAASNENEAFLSRSAESTVAGDLVDDRFGTGREVSAIVAYHRPGGLTEADIAQIDAEARSLSDSRAIGDLKAVTTPYTSACGELGGGVVPETPPSQVSADGSTALVSVDTTSEDTRDVVRDVATAS